MGRGGQDVANRRVIIGILPCVVVTSLETGASIARIVCIDMLMVRRIPARGRKVRVLKEQLRFWKKKRSKVVYLKIQMKEVCSAECWANELERFDGTRYKILRTHLVRSSNSGKKRAISRRYPKWRTSWAKSLRVRFWGKNTWGISQQEEYVRKAAWNLARKLFKLKVEDKATFYSLVKK